MARTAVPVIAWQFVKRGVRIMHRSLLCWYALFLVTTHTQALHSTSGGFDLEGIIANIAE